MKSATSFARDLRANHTDAEAKFWSEVRARRLGGYKFVRQVPVGRYTADFVCRARRLVVEIDGSQHGESRYDDERTAFLNAEGYGVIRFWNDEVLRETDDVMNTLLLVLEGGITETRSDLRYLPACPPSPRGGEG